jgi:hypothetical protein
MRILFRVKSASGFELVRVKQRFADYLTESLGCFQYTVRGTDFRTNEKATCV